MAETVIDPKTTSAAAPPTKPLATPAKPIFHPPQINTKLQRNTHGEYQCPHCKTFKPMELFAPYSRDNGMGIVTYLQPICTECRVKNLNAGRTAAAARAREAKQTKKHPEKQRTPVTATTTATVATTTAAAPVEPKKTEEIAAPEVKQQKVSLREWLTRQQSEQRYSVFSMTEVVITPADEEAMYYLLLPEGGPGEPVTERMLSFILGVMYEIEDATQLKGYVLA